MNKRNIGNENESRARKYLSDLGYEIIDTNFYALHKEIDIIAYDKDYLCFIEVKYRKRDGLTSGLEAITKNKQNNIIKAAKIYLYENKLSENTNCRFDVVSIDGDDITLIKNAFM